MATVLDSLAIATGADDGVWSPVAAANIFSNSGNSLLAGNNSSLGDEPEHVFLRFTGLTASYGAQIISAPLLLTVTADSSPVLRVYGEKAANPAAVASAADGDARVLTTAYVDWLPGTSTGSLTVDVAAVLQEIVGQATWAPNNAFQLFVKDNGSPALNNLLTARSFNFSSGSAKPTLPVTWSVLTAGAQPRYFPSPHLLKPTPLSDVYQTKPHLLNPAEAPQYLPGRRIQRISL